MTGTATNPRARSRAHPRQYQPGAHRTGNAAALRRELEQIELGTPDIKRVVRLVTQLNNAQHAVKHKAVSFKTMRERENFYVAFFRAPRKLNIPMSQTGT